MLIPLSDILYDEKFNARGWIADITIEDLAKSMEVCGLAQPVVVRPNACPPYHLVCGHRRYQAAKLLGWEKIPAVVMELDDQAARMLNLQENLERADLTPSQELTAILSMYGDRPDTAKVARELGRSRKWVNERLAILKLDERVRKDVDAGLLSAFDISCLIVTPKHEQYDLALKLKAAHDGGKSTSSVIAKERNIVRRAHSRSAIQKMLTELMDRGIKPDGYRCLAWAAGTITDEELYDS